MATVFITYRQQNSKHSNHKQRVRDLALQLRQAGITVILDALANEEEFHHGGPPDPNGWSGWSYAQVDRADKVLIVGSVDYFKVYENKESPGIGLGAAIEAQRIFQQLYNHRGQNERFRVVILDDGDDEWIPDHLIGYHRFHPNRTKNDFSDLVCWLNASPTTLPTSIPAVGPPTIEWPVALAGYEPDMANRGDEFAFFKSLLNDCSAERAIFFLGPSNHGKTALVSECAKYSVCLLPTNAFVQVDFKVNPSKDFAIDTLRLDLQGLLPMFCKPNGNVNQLRQDLRALVSPALFVFDTYEKSSPEARELVNTLIADLDKCPALRMVVAGQIVPDHATALWAPKVRCFSLGPIDNAGQWTGYASRHYPKLTEDHIQAITSISNGIPGTQLAHFMAVVADLSAP